MCNSREVESVALLHVSRVTVALSTQKYLHLVMLEVHSCIAIELSCPIRVSRAPGSSMCPESVAQAERWLHIQCM